MGYCANNAHVDISAETLQGFLENAWDAAPDNANTLRDQLRVYEKSALNLFSGGSIGSVSKNSTSQSYRGPGLGSYTPVQIANAWRMLISLFEMEKCRTDNAYKAATAIPPQSWAVPFLTQFPDYAQDTDPAVYGLMKKQLEPVNEYQTDMTLLRLEPTLSPGYGVAGYNPTW
jgi:hypothetical protein